MSTTDVMRETKIATTMSPSCERNAVGGTYTLVVRLEQPARIGFGAAGDRDLQPGWYAYVGSAFGPGGFARIDRHRRLASGVCQTRHWHIDYLLGHSAAVIESVVR